MSQTVEHRVIHLIAKTQNKTPDEIQLDQSIEEICDTSLDLVNLLFDLEDEFDREIPDDTKNARTVREIVYGIEQLVHATVNEEPVT